MIVYGIAWVIFDVSDGSHGGDTSRLDEADSGKFRVSSHSELCNKRTVKGINKFY